MNIQGFLFAHGEKLLLALVLLICAVAFYSTVSDAGTRSETSLAQVNEVVAKLERAYQSPGWPNLAATRAFEEEIKTRFQLQVGAQPVVAGLTGKPDASRGDDVGGERRIYAYEIVTPSVALEDQVGSLRVRVSVPSGPRPDAPDDYIADAADGVQWTRPEPKRGEVVNLAQHVGVLIEYRIYRDKMGVNEGWQPIVSEDAPGGVLPVVGGSGQAVIPGVEPWQTYDVRARVLVAATGTVSKDEDAWKIGREVAVFAKPLPVSPPPRTWSAAKEQLEARFLNGDFDRLLATPYAGPTPAFTPRVRANAARGAAARPELGVPGMGQPDMAQPGMTTPAPAVNLAQLPIGYFVGAPSDFASVQTKGSIYLGLKRVSGSIPGVPASATIIVKRLVKDAEGNDRGWTEAVEYKVQEGEVIGKTEFLKVPGAKVDREPVDLSTPFKVKEIKKDVPRIWYYEVREKSVQTPDGSFQKQMVIEPKEKTADVVILQNTKDENAELRLIQFARITPPFAGRWSYPAIPDGGIDEEEVFKTAPLQWENPELVPKAPIEHTDRKLLEQLIPPAQAAFAALPYVEMPDGRVIYYYEPDKRALMRVIPGSLWDKQGAPQPLAPKAGTQPQPADPGLAPPPEALPPEFEDGLVPPEGFEPTPPDAGRRRR